MIESANSKGKHLPLHNNNEEGVSIILTFVKRFHPFQWMCIIGGIFMVFSHSNSQSLILSREPASLTQTASYKTSMKLDAFNKINFRILDSRTIKNCECGCPNSVISNCPRQYDLQDIDKSASVIITRPIRNHMEFALQEKKYDSQIACMDDSNPDDTHRTDTGGYCLHNILKVTQEQGQHRVRGEVILPFPDRAIPIPNGYAEPSSDMLEMLNTFIQEEKISTLSDFGAGIGQYGAFLERTFRNKLLYRGYDGAGDVELYTQGFVKFFDLSIPLNLPVSDWVMAFSVAEQIPAHLEGMVIRNLHAHNCRGILLSWGTPGLGGNHVNVHDNQYLFDVFEGLGYYHDKEESERFRDKMGEKATWFKETFMVLRRQNPVC
jgi:hypothetical protein